MVRIEPAVTHLKYKNASYRVIDTPEWWQCWRMRSSETQNLWFIEGEPVSSKGSLRTGGKRTSTAGNFAERAVSAAMK